MADVLTAVWTAVCMLGAAAFFLALVIGIGCILFPPRLRE